MRRFIRFLKRSGLGQALVIVMCASVLVTTIPQRVQAQGLVEYSIVLALIAILVIVAEQLPQQTRLVGLHRF